MCAIFGIGFLEGYTVNNEGMVKLFINHLFREAQSRGAHASGLVVTTEKGMHVLKDKVSGSNFVSTDKYMDFLNQHIKLNPKAYPRLISVLGHCRFPTKGSVDVYENNHPIVTENVIGIHNGAIENDEEIWNIFQKQQTFERRARVDSEIIFKLLDFYSTTQKLKMSKAINNASKAMIGSYACAALHKKIPWTIWLFRRYNSTDVIVLEDLGLVVFATDKRFIQEALNISRLGGGISLDSGTTIDYPINSGMSINMYTKKIYSFKLDEIDKRIPLHTTVNTRNSFTEA